MTLFASQLLLLSQLRAVSPAHTHTHTVPQQLPVSACIVHLNSNLYLPHSTMAESVAMAAGVGEGRVGRVEDSRTWGHAEHASCQRAGICTGIASLERVCAVARDPDKTTCPNRVSLKLETGRVRAICHCCYCLAI